VGSAAIEVDDEYTDMPDFVELSDDSDDEEDLEGESFEVSIDEEALFVPYRWIDDEIIESHEATVVQSTEVEYPESNVEVGDADEAAVNAEEDVVAAIEHAEGTSGA
jgi:hypothetical protein